MIPFTIKLAHLSYQYHSTYHARLFNISPPVLAGIGVSLIFIPAAVVCSTYFKRLRPLALGIGTSGVGLFCLAIPPLLRLAIAHYGWRNAMILMSALCIQSCLFSFMLLPIEHWQPPVQRHCIVSVTTLLDSQKLDDTLIHKESHMRKITNYIVSIFDLDLLCDVTFIIFFVNNILWNISSLIMLVMITEYAILSGMASSCAPWLISVIGLWGIVGRAGAGAIANLPGVKRFWVYNIATAVSGFAIGGLPWNITFPYFAVLCSLYGLCFGAQCGVLAVIITELFGVNNLSMAYGYIMVAHGLGALCGPPLGGLLYELTLGYDVPFYFAGAVSVVTSLLACFIPIINTCSKKRRYRQAPTEIKEVL